MEKNQEQSHFTKMVKKIKDNIKPLKKSKISNNPTINYHEIIITEEELKKWKEVNRNFIIGQIKKWKELGFTLEKSKKWIALGLVWACSWHSEEQKSKSLNRLLK